jgi:hypothetical protein
MNSIFSIAPPKTILIKDLSSLYNWKNIEENLKKVKLVKGDNYRISESKKLLDIILDNNMYHLEQEAEEFIKNVFPMDFNYQLKITESWINCMEPGDVHGWHNHPFSVVSGIILLDDTLENLNLQFKIDITDVTPPYSLLNVDYYVSLNDLVKDTNLKYHLILFYSNVSHSVPEVSGHRRSIAFNTFWKGTVNFGSSLSSYDFK